MVPGAGGLVGRGGTIAAELPAATRMGAVHLGVAALDRSLAYYEQTLGLRVHDRARGRATLGAGGEDLLVLIEHPGARPAHGFAGLYHFALLVPERADLARFLAHATHASAALTGLSDHFVSEAVYLADPDGHGIEVYADRPREAWAGQVAERLTTLPLDVPGLLGELGDPARADFTGLPADTVMGHVHLRVADVPDAVGFYRDVLGLGLMAALGDRAAFLAAGGYHHHVGANAWQSAGAAPAPEGTARLERMTIVLPDAEALDAAGERLERARVEAAAMDEGLSLRDPSGNPVGLTVG